MASSVHQFFLAIFLLCFGGLCSAIYDPSLTTTTKPPNRHESILPWYSNEDAKPPEESPRSPKWRTEEESKPKRNLALGTKSWTPWRKAPGSEIEQRTEVNENQDQNFHQIDQVDQTDQRESVEPPLEPRVHIQQREKEQNPYLNPRDRIPPHRAGVGNQKETTNEETLYPAREDRTKPYKEKILVATRPRQTVAWYDPKLGVRCPEPSATGQFVYPPDCKFFVNCWKGRAFVQSCAPGTLFNPETLECDFPHKVTCYAGELTDMHYGHHDNRGPDEWNKFQEPKCPPQLTGMLRHPTNCTKFLHCANGGTIIKECGPGTVFNPAISVCDWPRNVRGCEDALKPGVLNGDTLAPPNLPSYDHKKSDGYDTVKKIQCPRDFSGLLPHPETCKKFLQCANGITYVMDCGPGTAFNPETTVCDWPYNVPGCKEDKPMVTTPSYDHTTPRSWNTTVSRPTWRPTKLKPINETRWSMNNTQGRYNEGGYQPASPSWLPSEVKFNYSSYNHSYYYPGLYIYNGTLCLIPSSNPTHSQYPQASHQYNFTLCSDFVGKYYPYAVPYPSNHTSYPSQYPQPQPPHYPPPHPPYNNLPHPPHYPPPHPFPHPHPHSHLPHNPLPHPPHHLPPNPQPFPYPPNHLPHHPQPVPIPAPHPPFHPFPQPPVNYPPHPYPTQPYPMPYPTQYPHDVNRGRKLEDPEGQTSTQNHQWNQDTNDRDDDFARWRGKTNVFLQNNNQQGNQNVPQQPLYPNGIYVNQNGTWGHFIVKEPEINEGHSKTKNYSPNNLPTYNKTDNTRIDQPSINLQPPYPNFNNVFFRPNPFLPYRPLNQSPPQYPLPMGPVNYPHFNIFLPQVPPTYPPFGGPGVNVTLETYEPIVIEIEPSNNSRNSSSNPFLPSAFNGRWIPNYPINRTGRVGFRKINDTNGDHILMVDTGSLNSTPFNLSFYKDVFNFTDGLWVVPSTVLQPPLENPPNSANDNNNNNNGFRPIVSPSIYLQPPLEHPGNNQNFNAERPITPPATYLQPPFENSGPNRNQIQPPSTVLQPPFEDKNSDSQLPLNRPTGRQVPRPATHLQPPFENPNNNIQPPATHLLPPLETPMNREHSYNSQSPRTNPNSLPNQDTSTIRPFKPYPEITTKKSSVKQFELSEEIDRSITENPLTRTGPNVPTVSIETDNNSREDQRKEKPAEVPEVVEPEVDNYDVDLLDKRIWRPTLVFKNKTTKHNETHVMKIDKKTTDVDVFNVEAAPFNQEEPPFPVYYIPPVQPLTHSKQVGRMTPISGQVIRLRGGSGPYDGYLEVQGTQPGWGIVCDSRNSWTLKEAHVVCRQLGYPRGAEMAWQGRNNRSGVPTWIAANSVTCFGNETRFQSCKFTHDQECYVERDAVGVRCYPNRVAHCRNNEIPYEGQCYHLADTDNALNHAEALKYCAERNSRLIDITNQAENNFISEWMLLLHPSVSSVMTSGVGFTTFNRTLWMWEDSSQAKFKFTKWWPGWKEDKNQPPWVGARPACIVMKRKFPCHDRPDSICVADYFFWDVEDCTTSLKDHAYICKRPYDDIGCIYGKGTQYTGKANVTASGKECLFWSDPKISHPLTVNVINREIREKLKNSHNYCRNPNPNKESTPWCYTEPFGEVEQCDIPPCGSTGTNKRALLSNRQCEYFACSPDECIPNTWVCDGEKDCRNGADERQCSEHLNLFKKTGRYKLDGYDVEKLMNTPLKTCALRCKEADFTCRSFAHNAAGNICLLSDRNIGMTGALKPDKHFDYYEMTERSMKCDSMFVCRNKKCINQTQVCNGKNDCNDRSDESICTVENLDYDIRLGGSNNKHEGRVEVKILGYWGQVCDDGFGIINANVICKELGFNLGALEVKPGGFYGNLEPPTRFMVDQLKCRGNESSLRECDFEGWGVHNCQPEEAVGVVCKTAVDTCQEGHWKCDDSPVCIPTPFICDGVTDCPDGSDENSAHCDAPFELRLANGSNSMEGRVEVRHHGIWGTVCDDDFSVAAAVVICRSLGYGGSAIPKKNGFFGSGEGPIWLDEVFCHGNESQLYKCKHNDWGKHNCDHNEDAGVVCSPGTIRDPELWKVVPAPEVNINDLLPTNCGQRSKDFDDDEDHIFEKVVHGSIAARGTYPWQASIRIRGHSRSSHWCGGVIISPLHVLTAAHCLEHYTKGAYFVRAGDYDTDVDEGTEVEANIEDYYIHEDFRKGHRMNNDIALILLKGRGIPLGKDIMPICLPAENAEYPAGLNCTISGFGSIETGRSNQSKKLRYGWIPLLDQSLCRAEYVYGVSISDGMVCAGHLDEGVDTCDGDSGGPLACYYNGAFTLYGITSWGQHCGEANKPGVYVRVAHYRRWINEKIKESLGGR